MDNLIKYVPLPKRNAIRDIYRDQDGIWVCLNKGWKTFDEYHTIHVDTIKEMKEEIKNITKEY